MVVDAPGPDGSTFPIDDDRLAPHRTVLEAVADASPPVRCAYAAAHVVMRPGYEDVGHSLTTPGSPDAIAEWIDFDATIAFRRHLDACGFGIAEAMDTAQRFFIGWKNAERLIRACGDLGLRHGFVAGAGADHLASVASTTALVDGVVHQARVIQAAGGVPVLLPLPWLPRSGADEATYVATYTAIVDELDGPLVLHWLGEMFLAELKGYFPGDSFDRVMAHAPDKVRACKLSLLDRELELRVRRELLPRDQFVMTGDDFHFASLIAGEGVAPVERWSTFDDRPLALGDFSHALLGVLDGIAAPAGLALALLGHGERARYDAIMAPCEALGRCVFETPTQHYKAGLAFLAWLNGHQDDFALVNHEQRARDRDHYLRVAALAAEAGALRDAELAGRRLREFVERTPA